MQEAQFLDARSSFRKDPDNIERAKDLAACPHQVEQFHVAARYLRLFFAGKPGRDGRVVPRSSLITVDNLVTVLQTAMSPGIGEFYAILDERGELDSNTSIKYLVEVLHECRRLKVPQNLIGGVACVHASLVGRWANSARRVAEIRLVA